MAREMNGKYLKLIKKKNLPPHLFSSTLLDLATDTSGKTKFNHNV